MRKKYPHFSQFLSLSLCVLTKYFRNLIGFRFGWFIWHARPLPQYELMIFLVANSFITSELAILVQKIFAAHCMTHNHSIRQNISAVVGSVGTAAVRQNDLISCFICGSCQFYFQTDRSPFTLQMPTIVKHSIKRCLYLDMLSFTLNKRLYWWRYLFPCRARDTTTLNHKFHSAHHTHSWRTISKNKTLTLRIRNGISSRADATESMDNWIDLILQQQNYCSLLSIVIGQIVSIDRLMPSKFASENWANASKSLSS